jgi:eukaryotic translation initiation factor 2C
VRSNKETEYGQTLNPNLPLVNLGSADRPNYVPAEHCKIKPGQATKARLTPFEQDAMIQFACRSPASNAKSIMEFGRRLLGLDGNDFLAKFGIKVGPQLITVTGRELPAPVIAYGGGGKTMPADGSWNMRGLKIIKPSRPIKSWSFINIGNPNNNQNIANVAKRFVEFLAKNMGIRIPSTPAVAGASVYPNVNEEGFRKAFESLGLKNRGPGSGQGPQGPELVLVFLYDKTAQVYNTVKMLGDVELGVQTVCVVQEKILPGSPAYFANVGLKVNLKFGGINHALQDDIPLIKAGKTMLVGYDVTHPTNLGPGMAQNAPSVVGLVASVDKDLAQWPAVVWNNQAGVEQLDEQLTANFQSRLNLWQKTNSSLPDNIVIFRDGVSEGQYEMVLSKELPHIRNACRAMGPKYRPRISVIVAVKRHHTRFYPTDAAHTHSRSKSPLQGTVVDRGVTNVRYWDFFLQAHASLQGMWKDQKPLTTEGDHG